MSKIEKLIKKLRNNPKDTNINTIKKILDKYELEYIWGKGDHLNVKHPLADYILTIPAHKPIKPIYIMKLLQMIDEINGE
ncbi:MAG: type II toxin-antitoxin system HicA family toxin [Epsilonproteobacteria bacterium]|nr:MAG: type II toxin-antitoxin system HicA family toxin [Campylobacterota bacterium]